MVAALTFFHIISAMAWMGGLAFFLSAVGPGVGSFTPAASLEFLTKVGPRQLRFFIGAASATLLFGLLLLGVAFGWSPMSWPASIEAGFGLGLVAYLIAVLVTAPAFRRAAKIAQEMASGQRQGPPPPEFPGLMKRVSMASMAVELMLVLTLIFMVTTAVFS